MQGDGKTTARADLGAVLAAMPSFGVLAIACLLVLGLLAADRAVGDVFIFESPTGIPSLVAAFLFGIAALIFWTRGMSAPAALFAGTALAQLAGLPQRVLLEAGVSDRRIALVVAVILAFAAVLVVVAHQRLRTSMDSPAHGEVAPRLIRQVRKIDPRGGALALALAYLAVCGLGAVVLLADLPIDALVINHEGAYPQYFNGAVLLGAALLSALAWSARIGGIDPRWWLGFALFLAFLGIDESIGFHERVQSELEINAKVVLAPIALTGAVLFLATYRAAARFPGPRALYIVAAACFAFSQLVDVVGDSDVFSAMEELLESAGSCLLLAALFLLIRADEGEARLPGLRTDRAPTAR